MIRSLLMLSMVLLGACSQAPESSDAESPLPTSNTRLKQNFDYIEGQVRDAAATPEVGVWVIAQTDDLPTPYRKIVVTDSDGRYVIPELPAATYTVWVRGYGLVDSKPTSARPGDVLALTSQPAATAVEAARIYPASYWLSLLRPPGGDANWVHHFKLGCQLCHQIGSQVTRTKSRDEYDTGLKKASYMNLVADALGREQLLDTLADWQQRIANGETPAAPERPKGIERNFVITQWAWGDALTYSHDEIATDKRNPTLYANGLIYGVDIANDRLLMLDPVTSTATYSDVPTLPGFDTAWCDQTYKALTADTIVPVGFGSLGCPAPGGISGFTGRYQNPANPHNPMLDSSGRVWLTTQIRRQWSEDLPSFCHADSTITDNYHHRQLGWYDTHTQAYQLIDTCYGTHHLQFDNNGVLWTSGDSAVIGWFDPAKYDPQEPASLAAAQGWTEVKVDSDGDGSPDLPQIGFNYGVIPNPVDGSVWTAQPDGNPGDALSQRGRLIRYDPKADRHEVYVPPVPGAGPRGVDVDSKGVIWAALGGSGHLARFDRSLCTTHWGTGDQCSQGWRLFRSPGPMIATSEETERGADFHYYLFVDQFNTLGLGSDTVIMNGTGSDSLLVFDQNTETFTTIRIPYPLNTYTRGLDGRIDDAGTGWRGRGLWFTNGLDPLIHSEIPRSYVGKIQLRPDPLAH